MLRSLTALLLLLALGACATLQGNDPVRVYLVGVESLPGQGMELRLAVKLRVQNPNDAPVEFDGVALDLELRGYDFASGVADIKGSVPRFGETVLVIPVTVPVTAILKQAYSFASGERAKVTYVARGKLSGSGFGATRFESRGDFDLPTDMGGTARK